MLEATLTATPTDGRVTFELTVENAGDAPERLSFRSGQRAEFAVRPADADPDDERAAVWRWSRGRMFAQALGEEVIEPGESRRYEGDWDDPDPGEYVAVGRVVCDDRDVTAETDLSV